MTRPWHACSAEEFVRIWQEASSVEEVANRLGIEEGSARARATLYRRRGIPLKKYLYSVDVEKLIALALELAPAPRRRMRAVP